MTRIFCLRCGCGIIINHPYHPARHEEVADYQDCDFINRTVIRFLWSQETLWNARYIDQHGHCVLEHRRTCTLDFLSPGRFVTVPTHPHDHASPEPSLFSGDDEEYEEGEEEDALGEEDEGDDMQGVQTTSDIRPPPPPPINYSAEMPPNYDASLPNGISTAPAYSPPNDSIIAPPQSPAPSATRWADIHSPTPTP